MQRERPGDQIPDKLRVFAIHSLKCHFAFVKKKKEKKNEKKYFGAENYSKQITFFYSC